MNAKQIQAAVEAVLFAAGEPLELSRLAQALEVNEGLMEQILKNLEAQLDERGSGLCLLRLGNRYQLCTRTEFAQSVRQALEIKRNAPLSQAAFEVLAVVAYNQPVTKSFVEQVRGVDCSGVVNTLCQKGLLEKKGGWSFREGHFSMAQRRSFLRCFSFFLTGGFAAVAGDPSSEKNPHRGERCGGFRGICAFYRRREGR